MASVDHTTADADRFSDFLTLDPAGPAGPVMRRSRAHRRRRRSALVVLCVVLLVGGLVATTADVRVSRSRGEVRQYVDDATRASRSVQLDLGSAPDPDVMRDVMKGHLDALARNGLAARAATQGPMWTLTSHVGTAPAQTAALREDSARLALMAAAATPLAASLDALRSHTADADALDDLARGLSRYTTAAQRAGSDGVPTLERAALAAGLLTDLAGFQEPRTWTFRSVDNAGSVRSCDRLTVADGVVISHRSLRRCPRVRDLTVTTTGPNTSADTLFGRAEPGVPRRLDPPAVFALLLGPPSAITSSGAVEEATLQLL